MSQEGSLSAVWLTQPDPNSERTKNSTQEEVGKVAQSVMCLTLEHRNTSLIPRTCEKKLGVVVHAGEVETDGTVGFPKYPV